MKSKIKSHLYLAPASLAKFIQSQKIFVVLFVALTLGACTEKDPKPENALIANAGADQQVKVMDTVALDGRGSSDKANQTLTFKWEITKKPVNSTAQLTGATSAQPTFIADASGDFEIQLTVSNGSETGTDKVLVVAAQLQPVVIEKDITIPTVLEDRIANPDFPDYIVSKDVAVKSQLTLHPGVVIAYARDARFTIADKGGVLIAKGIPERKIRFIGQQPVKGFWSGIMLNSTSSGNILEYAEILHAGSQTMLDNTKMALAMFIESQAAIKNCLFSANDGYGLFIQEGAILREFSTNTFTSNSQAGIRLPADYVSILDQASVFTGGNGRNVVEVIGAFLGNPNVKEEVTWKGFTDKTPYRLMNRIAVRTGWKLNPGVTIEVTGDAAIIINEEAYLIAKGTETNKIKFTGSTNTAAFWSGILVHSQNQQNLIQYAEITNAGSIPLVSSEAANLALYGDNARMTVKNTRIAGSGGYGIWVGYGSLINGDYADSNVFENNKSGAVYGQLIENGRTAPKK